MNLKKGVRDFVEGYKNLFLDKFETLSRHIREQAIFRSYKCSDCLKQGHCHPPPKGCGCKTPALFYAPRKTDENGKWQEMLNQEEWDTFKKNNEEYKEFMEILETQKLDINDWIPNALSSETGRS